MTGKRQGIDVHFFHIDGDHTCCLRTVHDESQSVFMAKAADFFDGKNGAAYVAGMCHDNRFCVLLYEGSQRIRT